MSIQKNSCRGLVSALAMALVMAAGLLMTPRAQAQYGQAANFADVLNPEIFRRDLQLIQEGLDLDEAQSAILESIYFQYEDAFEAGKQSMLNEFQEMREELQTGDRDRVLQLVFKPFEDWARERAGLREDFIADVQVILNDEQMAAWPAFHREFLRAKVLPRGRFAGEKLNLFRVVERMDLPMNVQRSLDPVLESYGIDLHRTLEQREQAIRIGQAEVIKARVAVRNVNDQYIETIANALSGAYGEAFREAALEEGYPRAYRPTPAMQVFEAALELDGLSPETLNAIRNLQSEFLVRIEEINQRLLRKMREFEPRRAEHQAKAYLDQMNGQPPARLEDPTREDYTARRELGRQYVEQLRDLMTEEEFARIPGTARVLRQPSVNPKSLKETMDTSGNRKIRTPDDKFRHNARPGFGGQGSGKEAPPPK